ncbi:DNA methyltransferase [uncultured Thiocystis sp.]|uniref:Eco57I restriction-modification methylase domain-containing protein n=1 Tax=uncultured Thiocystis sp. TaxID=1202134 RepID=UPI0025E19AD8|nr:DNA methyltransferase [uncultured Thiocystis sp.]
MDKDTRNRIERATQAARALLEQDFADQLAGVFDIRLDGTLAAKPGGHLDAAQRVLWGKLMAAVEHHRASGQRASEAVATYLREAAFITLNRFVAIKMLEARGLVQECVSRGEQSAGFKEFCGLAPGLVQLPDHGYRLYIESLFDELSTEVKVLFDRRDPSSVLWPKRATFEHLLTILNAAELAGVWGEDETIGWVYQFFNGLDERRKMREESQAPRNSRELAVRNQFFTPRYVVQFLTDNTLGRIWYEMRCTETVLANQCEYMVRKPGETFAPRAKKDPRDLRVLDPACGSGHFLLYAFDLLLVIYEEAWADPGSPRSEATGRTLAADYPSLDTLRKAVPGLVLAHNLHGVDIDPRCAQIAQLALWMRAQRAYRDFGIGRAERPQIRRSNIVVAEPLVADEQIAKEFVAKLGDAELGRVFMALVESLSLAGDLGLLLRVEQIVARQAKRGQTGDLFAPPKERIRAVLDRFVRDEASVTSTRRRLFADDTAHGLALLGVAEKKFDAMLMNPPFGEPTEKSAANLASSYEDWNKNILCAFIARAQTLLATGGMCGTVVDRTINEKSTYEKFRRRYLLSDEFALQDVADLGWGILDANVEVASLVLGPGGPGHSFLGIDARTNEAKAEALRDKKLAVMMGVREAIRLPNAVIGYFFPAFAIRLFDTLPSMRDAGFDLFEGHTLKSERYFRVAWESPDRGRGYWTPLFNGTSYSRFAYPHHDVVSMHPSSGVWGDSAAVIRNVQKHGKPGLCFGKRGEYVDAQMLPPGFTSTVEGKACLTPSTEDAWAGLALMNSSLFQFLINLYTGQHKYSGYVELIPYPGSDRLHEAVECAQEIVRAKSLFWSHVELSSSFSGLARLDPECLREEFDKAITNVAALEAAMDDAVLQAYGLADDPNARAVVSSISASVPASDRDSFCSTDLADCAARCVQVAAGQTFGRFSAAEAVQKDVLVDDLGGTDDFAATVEGHLGDNVASVLTALNGGDLRAYIRDSLFAFHLDYYSRSGRKAPIYWQLATPSASYSVWLYIHAFSKDTLFRVQNDYVAPKLAHEERRLEALAKDLRDGATAAQRKDLATQEALVEELRAFLAEVKRVAPLWNPDLDDGVIVNFAPLWRLVPQNKSWQKELKTTWDALCEGKYDWAHLAMHLWPERVVPKCATDRSLAIAHGLEAVFWKEGDNGKWQPHPVAQAEVDRLIAERTSAAVKDALKSLLEAPAPVTGRGGSRKSSGRAPVRRTPTVPRSDNAGPGSKPATGSAAPDPVMLDAVKLVIAAAQGGASKSEVLAATGLTDAQWNSAINALLAEGTVTKTGAGRGTRYHLTPDP